MDDIDHEKMGAWLKKLSSLDDSADFDYDFEIADQDRHLSNAINKLRLIGEVFAKAVQNAENCQIAREFIISIESGGSTELIKALNELRVR